jgi:uncharacterized protein DUF6599
MKVRFSRLFLPITAIALLSAFAVPGCKNRARDPFPASAEIAGWQKSDQTRVFAAKDLWQYIDGDSEQYLQAGVLSTSTSDYKYNNNLEAVVDVHTLKEPAGAQRILDNGRGPDAQTVQLGDSGIAYAQSVVFRKGSRLVRIVAYQSTPDTQQALLALAHGVEAKL